MRCETRFGESQSGLKLQRRLRSGIAVAKRSKCSANPFLAPLDHNDSSPGVVQIAKHAKSHLQTIAEERKALIAAERQNLEKLLVAISGSINRDLPLRIEDILKREVANVASQISSSVGSSLSEALHRELSSGALQVIQFLCWKEQHPSGHSQFDLNCSKTNETVRP